jgi:hypothetical protein
MLESAAEEQHGDLYTKNLNPAAVARRANAENRQDRVLASLSGNGSAEDSTSLLELP